MYFLNRFLRKNQIELSNQNKARDYLKFVFELQAESQEQEMEVVEMLSDNLKEVLFKAVNGRALQRCRIIKNNFSTRFTSLLSSTLEDKIYAPDEMIFTEGDYENQCLYFIKRGEVETYIQKYDLHLKRLGHDSCFGESSFITQEAKQYSAKSIRFSSIVVLKLSEFLRIAEDYTSEKEMYHMLKDRVKFNKEYFLITSKCQLCSRINHNLFNCPLLFPQKDIASIIDAYLEDLEHFRKTFKRHGTRTKNARANWKINSEKAKAYVEAFSSIVIPEPPPIDKTSEVFRRSDIKKLTKSTQVEKYRKYRSTFDQVTERTETQESVVRLSSLPNYEEDFASRENENSLLRSPPLRPFRETNIMNSPGLKGSSDRYQISVDPLNRSLDDSQIEKLQSVHFDDEQPEENKKTITLATIEENKEEHEVKTPTKVDSLKKMNFPGSVGSIGDLREDKEKIFTPKFLLRPPPKFIEDDFVFDSVKNYEIYLPQNNASKVADDIEARLDQRKRVEIGLYTQKEINVFKLKLGRIMSNLKKQSAQEKSKEEKIGSKELNFGPAIFA